MFAFTNRFTDAAARFYAGWGRYTYCPDPARK